MEYSKDMNGQTMPRRGTLLRGLLVAVMLGLALLVLTAWQTIATLWLKLGTTEVLRAAAENPLAGAMGAQFAHFIAAQLMLHAGFGVLAWLLALLTAWTWRRAAPQFIGLVVLWYCLLTVAVLAYGATWFPRSGNGGYYHALATRTVGPYSAGELIAGTVLALALLLSTVTAMRLVAYAAAHQRSWAMTAITGAALATTALVTAAAIGPASTTSVVQADRPNVILLGIDSLRLEQLRRFGGSGATRHLDEFLAKADLVPDATTPVARTFPSWLAILTGRSPRTTGAVFNLMQRGMIQVNPTLGDILRANGYRTIYATDEVRFAPIDESYGFDQVVTPPIGAADFLIGNFNDLPLATVVANTRVGRLLFPYSHGNRGAAIVFQPETFLSRLDREVRFEGPTMLAVHLTAAHWPYFISDTPPNDEMRPNHDHDRPLYLAGLRTVDAMFNHVIQILEGKGALENAIVVVLSDHGEALQLAGDRLVDETGMEVDGALVPPSILDQGHGQSVLSPVQYQILMSYRSFGPAAGFASSARDLPALATAEDIAPTILDLLHIEREKLGATGMSLAGVLRDEPGALALFASRLRYTETDLRVMPGVGEAIDEEETAKRNSVYFKVDVPTGRLHMRSDAVHLLMHFKERAVFDGHMILACLPGTPDSHQYLLLDRKSGAGRMLTRAPGRDDPEALRLWDALHAGFPGELRPPTILGPQDLQAARQAWDDLLMAHLSTSRNGPNAHGPRTN